MNGFNENVMRSTAPYLNLYRGGISAGISYIPTILAISTIPEPYYWHIKMTELKILVCEMAL